MYDVHQNKKKVKNHENVKDQKNVTKKNHEKLFIRMQSLGLGVSQRNGNLPNYTCGRRRFIGL